MSSEVLSGYTKDIIDAIQGTGTIPNLSDITEFIVHVSSIPFSCIADENFLNVKYASIDTNPKGKHLTYGENGCASPRCMQRSSDGVRHTEGLKETCPCKEICPDAQPLCFLELANWIERNSSNPGEHKRFDLSKVAFCTSHTSIISGSYGKTMRDHTGLSGYMNASTMGDVQNILRATYWFRKLTKSKESGTRIDYNWFSKKYAEQEVQLVLRKIRQVSFTIDNLIVKLMLTNPVSLSYKFVAKLTGDFFEALLDEYLAEPIYENNIPVEPTQCLYRDLALFSKTVKEDLQNLQSREWYDFTGSHPKFETLQRFLGAAKDRSIATSMSSNGRINESGLLLILKRIVLSQKRGIGYLPLLIGTPKMFEFEQQAAAPPMKISREESKRVFTTVYEEFGVELPQLHNIFRTESEDRTEPQKAIMADIADAMVAELKPTADTAVPVADGGKLEAARQLTNLARDNEWEIPTRDLYTGEKMGSLTAPSDPDDITSIGTFLFWFSLQLILNEIVTRFPDYGVGLEEFYVPFKIGAGVYEHSSFTGRLLCIQESGKDRLLIKLAGTFSWATCVAAKMMQTCLAENASHRNGLIGSHADWSHFKRVQQQREGAAFYSLDQLNPGVHNFYSDLQRSTDFLYRCYGSLYMKAFQKYTGFPPWYMKVILATYNSPIKITSIKHIWGDADTETKTVVKEFWMYDSTPMGMNLAKFCLHSSHVYAAGTARRLLRERYGTEWNISDPLEENR